VHVTLRDLGEHRLCDLLEPERVFQLWHPDLPDQFPPLASLDTHPISLPRQPTAFLGREHEVGEVVQLLWREDVQLLTLTGPGGIGKTRLALQSAAELLDAFSDGVFFVPLASLTDPALVPSAIAAALGIREEGRHSLSDRLHEFLAARHVLLLLDNVEHLVEAAAAVGELLGAAPSLTVLATSRVPLRLRAEREYPVPPLALPRRKPPPTAEQLSQYEAVRFFINRAQAVKPNFAVDNENAPAVAEICHRLDGLPLAIELAAARIRMLSPLAMLDRLEQRLPLLTSGARDAPARQQTLRQTIAWSHDLLSPDERILFRRLAVFAGGATLDAVDAVTNVGGDLDVFEGLERLIEQSLVRLEASSIEEPRFTMLETVREYAGEQLETSGEAATAQQAHAAYFLALVLQLQAKVRGPEQGPLLERLETEHDNLRAALTWFTDRDVDTALEFTEGIFWLWLHHGHESEARRSLDRVLTRSEGLVSLQYAEVLNEAGLFASHQRDYERSEEYSRKSLALLRQLGDTTSLPYTLLVLGGTVVMRGKRDEAMQLLEEAVALCRANGDDWGCATALGNLAQIVEAAGDYPRASELMEEKLTLFRTLGDQLAVAQSLSDLAWLAILQGNDAQAEALFNQAMRGEQSRAHQYSTLVARIGLGVLAHRAGNSDQAVSILQEVLGLARDFEESFVLAFCLESLGDIARSQGKVRQAAVYFLESLVEAGAARDDLSTVDALESLAGLAVDTEQFALAARLFGQAETQRSASGTRRPPFTQATFERDLRAARDRLGDADFDRAAAVGRALTRDDAIAAAFEAAAALAEAPGVFSTDESGTTEKNGPDRSATT
jgi:predicted ATPase